MKGYILLSTINLSISFLHGIRVKFLLCIVISTFIIISPDYFFNGIDEKKKNRVGTLLVIDLHRDRFWRFDDVAMWLITYADIHMQPEYSC